MAYLSNRTKHKLRKLITAKLPRRDREFLRRNNACLQACVYVAEMGSLHDAWRYAHSAQHASWMGWLLDAVGIDFPYSGLLRTHEDAENRCRYLHSCYPWRGIAARIARRNAAAKKRGR